MQYEAAIGVNRTTAQHGPLADAYVGRLELHLRHDFPELHAKRLVEHDAQSAAIAVLTDQGNRLGEMTIRQRGHRNQELIRKGFSGAHAYKYGGTFTGSQGPGGVSDDEVTAPD